ncbi:MAG: tetratricopeptide repeat protein [Oligoflexales bacterium]|nr:tetratricopeptide repeat protein [Oligoflexales bacterium]
MYENLKSILVDNSKYHLAKIVFCFSFLFLVSYFFAEPAYSSDSKSISEKNELFELEKQVWIAEPDEFSEVEQKISHLIQRNPDSPFPFYLLSHLYVRLFIYNHTNLAILRKASELAQHALELDTDQDYGYIVIAEILDLMGQTKSSLKFLDQSIKSQTHKPTWRYYFLKAKMQSDILPFKETKELLQKAMSTNSSQHEVIVPYIIAIEEREMNQDEFISSLDAWHKEFPNTLFLHTKALILTKANRYQESHLIYQQIYTKYPDTVEAKINDAMILYQKLNKPIDSEKLLLSALSHKSVSKDPLIKSVIHLHLASISLKAKNQGKAHQNFYLAITLAENSESMIFQIRQLYREQKKERQFAELLESVIKNSAGSGAIYALLGETFSEDLKENKKAIEAYENAIILDPNRSDYINGLGLVYYRMNEMNKALAQFSMAIEIDPDDATAKYNKACILSKIGRTLEALNTLREAIQLDPKLGETAKSDPDFDNIKNMHQFKTLVDNTSEEELIIESSHKP